MPPRFLVPAALVALSLAGCGSRTVAAAPQLATTLVTTGLSNPVFVTAPPGDSTRLFIVEQHTGAIRIFEAGALRPAPFLVVPNLSAGNEEGLLGLAFHPHYAQNGFFYVHCTRADGNVEIRRYHVTSNPDSADAASGAVILAVSHPQSNHNGGWIAFGPDGYLYDALGDGGNGGDTGPGHDPVTGNAQSDTTRLGKLLRLDVDGAFPYAIPAGNPWAASPSPKNEFWAKGLRNAWRNGFDRATGDLYIGDVGQNLWEEIDYQPAGAGGRNYGWRKFEGFALYNCPGPCDSSGLTRPVYSYAHSGSPGGCAVVGGYVYRGAAIPAVQGTYFFSDYCSNRVLTFHMAGGVLTEFTDRTAEMAPAVGSLSGITSFGEDGRGEMYVVTQGSGGPDGAVYKIVPAGPAGTNAAPPVAALAVSAPGPTRRSAARTWASGSPGTRRCGRACTTPGAAWCGFSRPAPGTPERTRSPGTAAIPVALPRPAACTWSA